MAVTTIRRVTTEECPWLDEDLATDSEVYVWRGYTYGCISPSGIAVSFYEGKHPFFEIPVDALGTFHVRALSA